MGIICFDENMFGNFPAIGIIFLSFYFNDFNYINFPYKLPFN